jgi:hypothetical protein
MKDEYNTALKAFKKTLTPHRQKVLAEHGIELPRVKSGASHQSPSPSRRRGRAKARRC